MKWAVLWVWFAFPWNLGPFPMTPGWYSQSAYPSLAECQEVLDNTQPPWPIMGMVCLGAGEDPPGRLSEIEEAD